MRGLGRAGAAAAVSALLLSGATPALANGNDAGSITFSGAVTLAFPCLVAGCTGTFAGTWTGVAAGVECVSCPMTAGFSYDETCPPILGNAGGLADLRDAAGNLVTQEYFTWTRDNAAVLILIGDSPFPSTSSADGAGSAAFVPLPGTFGPAQFVDCTSSNVVASVDGVAGWT